MNWTQNANQSYLKLADYAAQRSKELTPLLQPYIDTTDQYGKLVCEVVLVLGKTPPPTKRDAVTRDLMADVFDFLYEARALITKGKLEIAYPLARRAYESLTHGCLPPRTNPGGPLDRGKGDQEQ